jgi:transposase-like protein
MSTSRCPEPSGSSSALSLPHQRATIYNAERDATIEVRPVRYLNNIVEQDHRAVTRVVHPMLGFKSMKTAQRPWAGSERMHMLKKDKWLWERARRARHRPSPRHHILYLSAHGS